MQPLPHDAPVPAPDLERTGSPAPQAVSAAFGEVLFASEVIGVALVDRELRYRRVNAALAAMNGRAPAWHVGRAIADVLPPDAAAVLAPLLRRVMETGEPLVDLPFDAETARGRNRYLSTYQPVREDDGTITGLVAIVAERPQDEAALRASAARAEQVTNRIAAHLADGVFTMDAGGRLTWMNAAAERILGWRAEELLGDVLHDRVHFLHPDGTPFPMCDCPLGRVLPHGEPVLDLADQWIRRDGSFVHVVTTCSPIESEGRVVGAVLSLHDDTGRRRVEAEREALLLAAEQARAEAEAANRAKSDFLAVMSHELRTPLNAIGGYAELLELGIRGPITEPQREDLVRIQASQRHLLGLINEVLNYARLETGTVRYDLEPVRVRDALHAAEGLIAPQASARGLALAVDAAPPTLELRADADKLRQVVVNLLSNAVKFTDRGGRVRLWSEARGDTVAVHVRDTGIGIPADKLEAIFEPFVQVRADLTRPHEGTGLGLAISRDLARGMGGDLTAESVPGVGSTFTVVLPRG